VTNIKKILWIVMLVLLITGCGTSTSTTKPGVTVIFPTPTLSELPYPMAQPTTPDMNYTYPEPGVDAGMPTIVPTMTYHVTQLVVPTPTTGKSVITGQLVVGDKEGGPYIATLYLAKTLPPSNPDFPINILFKQTDPLLFRMLIQVAYLAMLFQGNMPLSFDSIWGFVSR
jgi:hypothetical protein